MPPHTQQGSKLVRTTMSQELQQQLQQKQPRLQQPIPAGGLLGAPPGLAMRLRSCPRLSARPGAQLP